MKNNIILHSSNQQIPVEKFLAAWIIWAERFHQSTAWEELHFPFDWQRDCLANLLHGGRISGLDAMLRFLASPSARDTMQITDDFLTANAIWLSKCNDATSSRGNPVTGAVLTAESVALWKALPEQERNHLLKEASGLASVFIREIQG